MDETELVGNPTNPTPEHQFLTLVFSSAMGQTVSVAAELGIADLLYERPKTIQELAAATETKPHALTSVMRTLTALGLFKETQSGSFALTELGAVMRSDKQGSLAKFAVRANRDYFHSMWANLMHSVKTGESAYEAVHGMNSYEFYQKHPEELALYQQAMAEQTDMEAQGIKDSYDFSKIGTVVDVGGGRGFLLQTVLEANPTLNGVLFDVPKVVEGVAETFQSAGLSDRTNVVGGDFFESVPEGGDLYIFKRVLVDRTDDQVIQILTNCRSAIASGVKILIVDPDINSLYGKLFDVFMLGMFASRIRTEEEWQSLFAGTGFCFTRSIDTDCTLMLIEAEAV